MLTENSGDAPGYLTGTTDDSPSTATRALVRGGLVASRRPERTPLANSGLKSSQCHICLTHEVTARWALLNPRRSLRSPSETEYRWYWGFVWDSIGIRLGFVWDSIPLSTPLPNHTQGVGSGGAYIMYRVCAPPGAAARGRCSLGPPPHGRRTPQTERERVGTARGIGLTDPHLRIEVAPCMHVNLNSNKLVGRSLRFSTNQLGIIMAPNE